MAWVLRGSWAKAMVAISLYLLLRQKANEESLTYVKTGTFLHSCLEVSPQQKDTHPYPETWQSSYQTVPLESHPGHIGWGPWPPQRVSDRWNRHISGWGWRAGKFTPYTQPYFTRRKTISRRVLSMPFVTNEPDQYLTSSLEIVYNVLLGGLWHWQNKMWKAGFIM